MPVPNDSTWVQTPSETRAEYPNKEKEHPLILFDNGNARRNDTLHVKIIYYDEVKTHLPDLVEIKSFHGLYLLKLHNDRVEKAGSEVQVSYKRIAADYKDIIASKSLNYIKAEVFEYYSVYLGLKARTLRDLRKMKKGQWAKKANKYRHKYEVELEADREKSGNKSNSKSKKKSKKKSGGKSKIKTKRRSYKSDSESLSENDISQSESQSESEYESSSESEEGLP